MKQVALKDICIKGSSPYKQKELLADGRFAVYGASGIAGYLDSYAQETNYIGIVKDGSGIGRVNFYPAKTSLIGTMQYILPKNGYDIRYIGYCLKSLDLSKYKQGAAIPHIYFKDYGERIVRIVEDEKEQQRIVERLDAAFAHIDELKANAEKQLSEARVLFQKALEKAMEPKEGWKMKTINDVASFRNGVAHEKEIDKDGKYIVINSKFVSSDGTVRKYTNEVLSPLFVDDIVMVMSDVPKGKTLAKCFIVDKNDKYSLNQRICAFQSKGVYIRFLYYMLNRNTNLLKYDNGENQTNLRKKQILECPVFYPNSKSEQQRIVARLDSLSAHVRELEEINKKLIAECDALKQALLRKVFE